MKYALDVNGNGDPDKHLYNPMIDNYNGAYVYPYFIKSIQINCKNPVIKGVELRVCAINTKKLSAPSAEDEVANAKLSPSASKDNLKVSCEASPMIKVLNTYPKLNPNCFSIGVNGVLNINTTSSGFLSLDNEDGELLCRVVDGKKNTTLKYRFKKDEKGRLSEFSEKKAKGMKLSLVYDANGACVDQTASSEVKGESRINSEASSSVDGTAGKTAR